MTARRSVAVLALVASLTSCDSGFTAKGRATTDSPLPRTCRLSIAEHGQGFACCSGPVDPQGFEKRFYASPSDDPYTITLHCDGFQDHAVNVRLGKDMSSSRPLDLGSIPMLPAS